MIGEECVDAVSTAPMSASGNDRAVTGARWSGRVFLDLKTKAPASEASPDHRVRKKPEVIEVPAPPIETQR